MLEALTDFAENGYREATLSIHPYYPVDSYIAGYAANEWSVPALLGVFFGACLLLFFLTHWIAYSVQPTLNRQELLTTMWFVLSGTIHLFFEGYYVVNFATLGSKQTLIGQMWKEYAFSDSRYLTRNTFVLCMESLTVIAWGPGCLTVAGLVVLRHPLRYPLQMMVSMGQFYGDVIYYTTAFLDHYVDDIVYSRPEAFYFWFYFVLMNFFWILVPGVLIYQSTIRAANAISIAERLDVGKKFQ